MKRHLFPARLAKLAGAGLIAVSSSAFANLTTIIQNRFGQPEPQQILSDVYHDPVSRDGVNFTGSTITATRLDDSGADSILKGERFTATAVARFSDYTQSYGVLNGGSFSAVLDVSGHDYNVVGSGTITVPPGQSFGRSGNSGTDSSTPSENSDGRDHVITYQISGAHPDPQYVQFWEDLPKTNQLVARDRTISDFNDLVIQLQPNAIPLPPALFTGAATGALMLVTKRRRERRWHPLWRYWFPRRR